MASPSLIDSLPIATVAPTQELAWPEFDRWQAAFAAVETFPPRWEGLQRVPPPHTREADEYHLRKLVLFSEWTDLIARRPAVRAHYARQRIRARVVRQDERAPCPVCEPFNSREVGAELDAMPPYHPGCRCVLVAMHRDPVDRRGRSYERPRSRLG
jgi:hypothetical protein